jgi:D-alanyl-D-alanine carboxypeptidase/D-alanyl-D-alanine-endopeptidase (penicillin-binding protein 4)
VQKAIASWSAANPATSALVWRLDPEGPPAFVGGFRPDTPRIPASTMKLVTSVGALLQLGPTFRFSTRLLAAQETAVVGRTLVGKVYLQGAGDPVLATRSYAGRYLSGRATPIVDLVRPVRTKGIRRLRGPLIADEHFFDARRMGPGWPSYYRAYASPLSGLVTNQNFSGNGRSSYVSSPALAAAQRVRAALKAVGVAHVGGLTVGVTPATARPIGTAVSPPLPAILRAMNLESDNFIAETLVKDVGAYGTGHGTTGAGVRRTQALLVDRGILGAGDRLVDGSGLSRDNRLAAASLVRLITEADSDPTWGPALISSLAQGGQGTLVRRFLTGPATKRVRAKTGYLNGVSAMAGRVVSRGGERYAFALLMSTPDILGARATQDRVVTLLASGSEDP